jgi:PTH1 family peptidyl-tRNA hydrolase
VSIPLVVAGLGNPGAVYACTRHNVGFCVVDALARRRGWRWEAGRGEFFFCQGSFGGREVVLLKPTTYMNNSGVAIRDALTATGGGPSDLMVVLDDVALPLGVLRIRMRGSDGGHNGLASVIYQMLTDEFPRIRCGIRHEPMPAGEDLAEFVLAPFTQEEHEKAEAMVQRAADAVEECLRSGIPRAMNLYNTVSEP